MLLAELLTSARCGEWVVKYHEHDSLLERRPDEDLTEEERARAWEEYEREKQGLYRYQLQQPPPLHVQQLQLQSHMSAYSIICGVVVVIGFLLCRLSREKNALYQCMRGTF